MKTNKKYLTSVLLSTVVSSNTIIPIYANEKEENNKSLINVINAGNIDVIGINSSNTKAKSSLKYKKYFEQYGEMYGVDPYLLMAMACTESNGNPNCKYAGNYGLMQINFTGKTKTVTAFNHKTQKYDTVKITNASQLLGESGVALNIRIGAMQVQEKAKELYYNPLATIQGYNMGQNGVKRAIAYYISNGNINTGKNLSLKNSQLENYIKSFDTNWVTKQFNKKTCLEIYKSNGGGGTPSYLINTLGYYLGEDKQPWIMDSAGNKYTINHDYTSSDTDLNSKVKKEMKCKVNDLKVRVGSGTSYSILGSINSGDIVRVLDELENGWVKIIYNNKIGYVSNVKEAYLENIVTESNPNKPEINTPNEPDIDTNTPEVDIPEYDKPDIDIDNNDKDEFKKIKLMKVKVNDLKIRTGSSTKHSIISSLDKGIIIEVVKELDNGWVEINYNDKVGYVSNVKGVYLEDFNDYIPDTSYENINTIENDYIEDDYSFVNLEEILLEENNSNSNYINIDASNINIKIPSNPSLSYTLEK